MLGGAWADRADDSDGGGDEAAQACDGEEVENDEVDRSPCVSGTPFGMGVDIRPELGDEVRGECEDECEDELRFAVHHIDKTDDSVEVVLVHVDQVFRILIHCKAPSLMPRTSVSRYPLGNRE